MHDRTTPHPTAAWMWARPRRSAARARRLRILFAVLLPLAVSACASQPASRIADPEPVAERELATPPGGDLVPSQPNGQVRLADGVFRVHLSNIRCVRAPCPNGYMVSDVEGRPPALRPGVPQPVSRMPEQVRFDAASGGAVEDGLVEQAHVGDGIVVDGRAWLIEGGRTLRVEVRQLLSD
ncbi:conserved hypothetical protein [Luteimonas sp. 9C]|uniref:hypothetical protein n=1 Tax=Luteimonas sp. 9C TaxID=2653148 RepID=UPI0012F4712C|nr:hypothetical protein [Luteimonas sp. 9C]VXB54735.1 conserved hypothetical protein [Luteimonas sp. 9C]